MAIFALNTLISWQQFREKVGNVSAGRDPSLPSLFDKRVTFLKIVKVCQRGRVYGQEAHSHFLFNSIDTILVIKITIIVSQ